MNPAAQQNSSLQAISGRHRSGKYLIRPCAETHGLAEWIETHQFRRHENERNRIDRHGRPRNRLYGVHLPGSRTPAVMKMSWIDPGYKLSRKLELFLRSLYKDYNKAAFSNVCALFHAAIPVAEPFAFWSDRRGRFDRRSYLLYRKVDSKVTLAEACEKISQSNDEHAQRITGGIRRRVMTVLREMHAAGFRYGDPHLNNILLGAGRGAGEITAQNVETMPICFIDYDHCSKTRLKLPALKHFLDLRDVCQANAGAGERALEELAAFYCGKTSPRQRAALRFWAGGGFNPLRWLDRRKKKSGRHLRRR